MSFRGPRTFSLRISPQAANAEGAQSVRWHADLVPRRRRNAATPNSNFQSSHDTIHMLPTDSEGKSRGDDVQGTEIPRMGL